MVKFILALLYILFPIVLELTVIPSLSVSACTILKTVIIRLQAQISEIGIVCWAVYRIIKSRDTMNVNTILPGIIFLCAFIADLIHMISEFYPSAIPFCPIFIRGLSYNIFLGGLLCYVYINFRKNLANPISRFFIITSFLTAVYLTHHYVLIPYFGNNDDIFLVVNSLLYTLLESLIISLVVPCVMRENDVKVHLLLQAILLMCISDLSIRYHIGMMNFLSSMAGFELVWQIAIAICFIIFLFSGDIDPMAEKSSTSFQSIRSFVAICSILFNCCFIALLIGFGLYKIGDVIHLSNILMVGFIVWFFSNVLAQYISTSMLRVNSTINELETGQDYKTDGLKDKNFLPAIPKYQNFYELRDLLVRLIEHSRLAAIGETTSLLAHDLRKPFSQIKLILNSFEFFKTNPSKLTQARQDVEKSIIHIDSMIEDIMNFLGKTAIHPSPQSMADVLDFSIRQVLCRYSQMTISMQYDFSASCMPVIDKERIARVFSNIIDNASDAIRQQGYVGKIWISTADKTINTDEFIEVVIGNDGPLIPESSLNKIFNSFYTSGKKNGTGLGLASSQKIIIQHKGIISASNRSDGQGVEFTILLPSSSLPEKGDFSSLPSSSQDASLSLNPDGHVEKCLSMLEKEDEKKILLLDDEVLYRAWFKNLINSYPLLKNITTVYDSSTVEEALKIAKKEKPDHAIVDIDLSQDNSSGFDFIKSAQEQFPSMKILLHSNRLSREIKEIASELKLANGVSKPLELKTLVEFLASSPPEDEDMGEAQSPPTASPHMPEIALVEDNDLMRKIMARSFTNVLVHEFSCPEDFFNKFESEPDFISAISCVITDYSFEEANSDTNGLHFALEVKRQFRLPVFLCSNSDLKTEKDIDFVDGIIPKDPASWGIIWNLIKFNSKLKRQKFYGV